MSGVRSHRAHRSQVVTGAEGEGQRRRAVDTLVGVTGWANDATHPHNSASPSSRSATRWKVGEAARQQRSPAEGEGFSQSTKVATLLSRKHLRFGWEAPRLIKVDQPYESAP